MQNARTFLIPVYVGPHRFWAFLGSLVKELHQNIRMVLAQNEPLKIHMITWFMGFFYNIEWPMITIAMDSWTNRCKWDGIGGHFWMLDGFTSKMIQHPWIHGFEDYGFRHDSWFGNMIQQELAHFMDSWFWGDMTRWFVDEKNMKQKTPDSTKKGGFLKWG